MAPTIADSAVLGGYVNAFYDTTSQALFGIAEAGSTIDVYLNGSSTATYTVQANSNGAWSQLVGDLANGAYSYTATATDAAGNTSAPSSPLAFTVATQAPTASATQSSSGLTNQTSDTITVTASAENVAGDSIADVAIYDGATLLGVASANGDGTWTFTAQHLADGDHSFQGATVSDAAGNATTSPLAATAVATQAPVVAIESAGGLTDQPTQTIIVSASAEAVSGDAISTVSLYDGSTLLAAATPDSNGL